MQYQRICSEVSQSEHSCGVVQDPAMHSHSIPNLSTAITVRLGPALTHLHHVNTVQVGSRGAEVLCQGDPDCISLQAVGRIHSGKEICRGGCR